jgi:DNA modification methylase
MSVTTRRKPSVGHNSGSIGGDGLCDYQLVWRPPGDLRVNPKNPRTHTKRKIQDLANSISVHGLMTPIVVDAANTIVAGRARWEAAKLLNLQRVPTISAAGMSREQLDIFMLADNKFAERAGWDRQQLALYLEDLQVRLEPLDLDLSVTGFEGAEIDLLLDDLGSEGSDAADQVPEVKGAPVTRRGDIWRLRKHRILCGDARLDLPRLMSEQKADAVFTDPPYNVRIAGHVQGRGKTRHKEFAFASGEMSDAEFKNFLNTSVAALVQISRPGAVHYICMDWRHIECLLAVAREHYDTTLNLCVWNKTTPAQGSFYRGQHELVGVFRVGDEAHQNNVQLGRFGRNRSNVWTYPGVNSFGKGRDEALAMHPTVKPVALVVDALRDCTGRGDLIVDPFLGSGTTLIAAERIGRRCFAIEFEPVYVDTAIRRWQGMTHCDALLEGDGRSFDEIAAERSEQDGDDTCGPATDLEGKETESGNTEEVE